MAWQIWLLGLFAKLYLQVDDTEELSCATQVQISKVKAEGDSGKPLCP